MTFLGLAVRLLLLVLAVWKCRYFSPAISIGLAAFLIYPLTFFALHRIALPDQGAQMAQALSTLDPSDVRPVCFLGRNSLAARVRVCTQGERSIRTIRFYPLFTPDGFFAVILPKRLLASINVDTQLVKTASRVFRDFDFRKANQRVAEETVESVFRGQPTGIKDHL